MLAIVISFCCVLYLPITISALGYVGKGDLNKIDSDLLFCLDSSDSMTKTYLVDVRLFSICDNAIDVELQKNYNITLSSYENLQIYEDQTIPILEQELKNKFSAEIIKQPIRNISQKIPTNEVSETVFDANKSNSVSQTDLAKIIQSQNSIFGKVDLKTIENYIDNEKSLLDLYVLGNSKNFIDARRQSVKSLISAQNKKFFKKLDGKDYSIVQKSDYVAALVMEATEQTIRYISTLSEVSYLYLYVNSDCNKMPSEMRRNSFNDWEASDPMGIEALKQSGGEETEYTGAGVKIGVIESIGKNVNEKKYFEGIGSGEDVAYQLANNANVHWQTYESPFSSEWSYGGKNEHSVLVTSIIAGQKKTVGLYEFEGVAPESTIYGLSISDRTTFRQALDTIIGFNVNVINVSVGFDDKIEGYDETDAYVDTIIAQHHIPVVVSAGNCKETNPNRRVTSPGMAYGAITVGNIDASSINPPYTVNGSSAYFQRTAQELDGEMKDFSWATNKPDIVAVGTNVSCAISQNNVHSASGTSYAAPYVTGIIALLMQHSPTLMNASYYTKAVLLASANGSANMISRANNNFSDPENNYLCNKSGAGMVNALRANQIVSRRYFAATVINLKYRQFLGEYSTFSCDGMNLANGEKVRVVMCFSKPGAEVLTSAYGNNLDLFLMQGGEIRTSSSAVRNNVEIVEYVAQINSLHRIRVDISSFVQSDEDQIMRIAVAFYVEGRS